MIEQLKDLQADLRSKPSDKNLGFIRALGDAIIQLGGRESEYKLNREKEERAAQ